MPKTIERESVAVAKVPTGHGGTLVHVDMYISQGKFEALVNALQKHDTPVAHDLIDLIEK